MTDADPGADLVTVRPVRAEDWASHRELRLEMLRDAPDAFWTQYDDVADLDEAAWRGRIATQHHLQARIGDDPVGSVGLFEDPDRPADTVTLVAMYVTPRARGRGLGNRLVQGVLDEAAARGRQRVLLEVTSSNASAIGLYERMGFRFDGTSRPHPRRSGLSELGMERRLAEGVPAGAEVGGDPTRVPQHRSDVEG